MEQHTSRLTTYIAQLDDRSMSTHDTITEAQVFYAKTDEEFFEITFTAAFYGALYPYDTPLYMDILCGHVLLFKIDGAAIVSLQEEYTKFARGKGITNADEIAWEEKMNACISSP